MSELLIDWTTPGGARCCCKNCSIASLIESGLITQPANPNTYDTWLSLNGQWPAMAGHDVVTLTESQYFELLAGGSLILSSSLSSSFETSTFCTQISSINTINVGGVLSEQFIFNQDGSCAHDSSVYNTNPAILPQRPFGYTSKTTLENSIAGTHTLTTIFSDSEVITTYQTGSVSLSYIIYLHEDLDNLRPSGTGMYSAKPQFSARHVAGFVRGGFGDSMNTRMFLTTETYKTGLELQLGQQYSPTQILFALSDSDFFLNAYQNINIVFLWSVIGTGCGGSTIDAYAASLSLSATYSPAPP